MRFSLYVLFLASAFYLQAAEEEAPVKRRPRIRVYDQSVNRVSVERRMEEDRSAELELEKRIRNDMGAPVSLENSFNPVSIISTVNTGSRESVSEDEEEEDSWVTASDFLLEEDMIEEDDLLLTVENEEDQNQEMEITDWEALQKSMIEDVLKKADPEMTDEEMEDAFFSEEDEDTMDTPASGGLEMADIAPLHDLQTQDRQMVREAVADPGQFVPVLQSVRQMNGEVSRPVRERDTPMSLSRSSGMLEELKEKWNRPSEITASRNSNTFSAPPLPRARMAMTALPSVSLANPAVRALPELSKTNSPASRPKPEALPQPQNESRGGMRKDYRIRSRLGVPSGM